MLDEFLEYPKYFICEYLNRRWVLIIAICLVLYFIYLRTYYTKREAFNSVIGKTKKATKTNVKSTSKINNIEHFEQFEQFKPFNNTTEMQTSTTQSSALPTEMQTSPTTTHASTVDSSNSSKITVTDTLFKNLQLSPAQMDTCILFYKRTIATVLANLKKLNIQSKVNQYLRIDKQYSKIIADGIDGIMNLLVKTIKSQFTVTRTSIKSDLIHSLQFNITAQIDSVNNDLIKDMNALAQMNSTTIDYNKQLQTINSLRTQIDELIAIDKLISNYGNTSSLQNSQINATLGKSALLPIYEKNIDKLNQMINSDFNGNEQRLTDKYGKMYTEFLAEDKKQQLDINPLTLASQIESGTIGILSKITNFLSNSSEVPAIAKNNDVVSPTKLVEQYGFIGDKISSSRNNIVPEGEIMPSTAGALNLENIFNDAGNRGNYLINNKTRKMLIEGFDIASTSNSTSNSTLSNTPSKTNAINTNNNNNNTGIVGQITSGVSNIASSLGGTGADTDNTDNTDNTNNGTDDTDGTDANANIFYNFIYYVLTNKS